MTTIPSYPDPQRVTLPRVVASEWTKLRSVASTAWSLFAAAVLLVGFSAAYALLRVTRPPSDPAGFDPTAVSLAGVGLAQIAIGVLGVLFMTGEYASGSIRASLAAVPARLPVLWGKAVVYALTTLALCVPASFAAFLIGQSVLSAEHLDITLSHPGTLRAVVGSALYLVVVGLLGIGLGGAIRSTAGAISALFGMLFVFQLVSGLLPESWSDHLYRYLPSPAGLAVTSVEPDAAALAPWTGFGLFCLYTAAILAVAAWRLRRRDA